MGRKIVRVAVVLGLLACSGCLSRETPQALCGEMPTAWFSEATGKSGLNSSVEVKRGSTQTLPFRWDAQHPFEAGTIQCSVTDGDDQLVEFEAGLRPADELGFYQQAVDENPDQERFTVAGGQGSFLVAAPPITKVDTYWYCGSSTLGLTIRKFASDDDKAALATQLTTRIAERVGCTQIYTRPTPTPSG